MLLLIVSNSNTFLHIVLSTLVFNLTSFLHRYQLFIHSFSLHKQSLKWDCSGLVAYFYYPMTTIMLSLFPSLYVFTHINSLLTELQPNIHISCESNYTFSFYQSQYPPPYTFVNIRHFVNVRLESNIMNPMIAIALSLLFFQTKTNKQTAQMILFVFQFTIASCYSPVTTIMLSLFLSQ